LLKIPLAVPAVQVVLIRGVASLLLIVPFPVPAQFTLNVYTVVPVPVPVRETVGAVPPTVLFIVNVSLWIPVVVAL
jgi:hypothetical protein